MHRYSEFLSRVLLLAACLLPLLAAGQTLNVTNDVRTYATITNTAVTLGGKTELHLTGTGDPLTGSTINLTSPDAWLFMTNIAPSTVVSTFLGRVRVNNNAAYVDANVRVVQYGQGAVVIPHAPTFAPMTVYAGNGFTSSSMSLTQYTAYGATELGALNDNISSFKLKRGYTATIAQNAAGTGISKNYVAADGDLEVSVLPANLNNSVSFVRIFQWRWVGKKGSCDVGADALNADWQYNWNISLNSTRDWEYVAIKQQPLWPSTVQDWKARGVNHLSGFNEPDNSVEDAYKNLTPVGDVANAVARMPELLGTGLRMGAPAVTDGGTSWITSYINQANAAGVRIDYVPVHYYRSYTSASDPAGATTQLYNFLKSIYDVAQRPIWVTEFNNGADWTTGPDPTTAQNAATIEAMINMMDSTPWIERYAIYSHVEWFRQTHYDDGYITPMGTMYRDHVAPIAYQQVLPDGLSANAVYAFEGDVQDTSGNANDAMRFGGPTFSTASGSAISLNGTSDYLRLPATVGDSNDFAFAAWVNWNGGGNFQRIFDFGAGGADNYVYLTPRTGTNTMRFGIRYGGVDQLVETAALPTGIWTHVAVTISNTTAKIFVNGTLRATNAAFTFDPAKLGTQFNYLGKSQWPDPLFNGKLDDVRVVSTFFTDAQVVALAGVGAPQFSANPVLTATAPTLRLFTGSIGNMATGGSGALTFSKVSGPSWLTVALNGTLSGVPGFADTGVNTFIVRVTDAGGAVTPLNTATLQVTVADSPGLVARYAFDGTANATVGIAHGVATGSPGYVAGLNSSAIDLDGTNDYVTLPKGVANHPEITVATWVWPDSTAVWQRIFDFGSGTTEAMFLTTNSGAGTLRFSIYNGVGTYELNTALLATGQWSHVAVTLGAGVGKLYVNGVLKDTKTIPLKPTDFSHDFGYIGKSQWPDALLNARIDDFLIFNQALNEAQIAGIYGGRAPAFTVDPINDKPAAVPAVAYEQTLAGTATDPDAGSTLTYSKVSGPTWLTVSPSGRIFGVPAAADAGTNRFIVRASDPTQLADEAALNIVVGNATGLIAHHQFNDSTADNIGGIAGITTIGAPAYTAGFFDRAIDLDGTDDVVQLRAGLLNGVTDMTIAARVRWDGGNDWQRIFDFGTGTTQYLFLTPKAGAVSRFAIKNGGAEQVLDGPALTIGEWAHVAITLIGDTGTLYLNGAAVATGSITIDPAAIAPTLNYLAKSQYAGDALFNGAIDDFRIYSRGLTAAEVSAFVVAPAPVSVPDSSYTAWGAGIVFPSGLSGPDADPDGDGVSNAWEYLMGYNPLTANGGVLPRSEIKSAAALGLEGTKTYLAIQARVRKQRLGATLAPRAAATLADLSQAAALSNVAQAGVPISDGIFEIITYYFQTPIEDSPSGTGFIRLDVAVP